METFSKIVAALMFIVMAWLLIANITQAKSVANNEELEHLQQCDQIMIGASFECDDEEDLEVCITQAMQGADCFIAVDDIDNKDWI